MIFKNCQLVKMWKIYLLIQIWNIYFFVVKDFEFILLCDSIIAEGLILTIILTVFMFSLEPHL